MYPQLQPGVVEQDMQQTYSYSKSEGFTNPPPVYDQTIYQQPEQIYEYQTNHLPHVPIYTDGENPKTTKVVRYGSMLLFIGTFLATLFLLADVIGGTFYFPYGDGTVSPHNSIGETIAKAILMLINAIILTMSAVFGILSTNKGNTQNSKYPLLHLAFLIIGMLVFLGEILVVHVSFFTTDYTIYFYHHASSYGSVFTPFLITFTILSVIGLICCCVCCVSGCVRFKNINRQNADV